MSQEPITLAGAVPVSSAAGGETSVAVPAHVSLFDADFVREGPDLLIVNDAVPVFRVGGFFSTIEPPVLVAGNGAELRGDIAARLAGSSVEAMVAQAGAVTAPVPIGQVERVSGEASVQRTDGSLQVLDIGDKIFQNDILITSANGTLSVTFSDGTIFSMSSDARMVIDELVFSPGGSDNAASFNLITGGFVFIAGQVASTGNMDVTTPAATMGIRGTTVYVDIQIGPDGIATVELALNFDNDGGLGSIEVFDLEGDLITVLTATETKWIITPTDGETREVPRDDQDRASNEVLLTEAVAALDLANLRVQGGDTFVTQGDTGEPGDGATAAPDGGDQELEQEPGTDVPLDGDGIAPLQEPGAPGPEDGTQDEGFLQPGGTGDPQDGIEQFDETRIDNARTPFDQTELASDIAISGPEDPPEGEGITGRLLEGETTGLTFAVVEEPANGVVTLGADGDFNFVPDPDFFGEDAFVFSVTDGDGNTDTGTVTVTVTPVNDDPVTTAVAAAGAEDDAISGQIVASDADDDTLAFTLQSGAMNGTVVLLSDGQYVYTPDPDFEGTDSFVYLVDDGNGGLDTGTVFLTVEPVADQPEIDAGISVLLADIGADPDAPGGEDPAAPILEAEGQIAFRDPDLGDSFTFSVVAAGEEVGEVEFLGAFAVGETVAGEAGAFSLPWRFEIDPETFATIGAGEVVTQDYAITVTDDQGLSDTTLVTITITGANDVPVAQADAAVVPPSGSVVIDPLANDFDPDGGPLSLVSVQAPLDGIVVQNPDGTVTYTPDEGFFGGDRFTYVVQDDQGAAEVGEVLLVVEQDPPIDVFPGGDVPVALDFSADGGEGAPAGSFVLEFDTAALQDQFGPEAGFVLVDFSVFLVADDVFLGQIAGAQDLAAAGSETFLLALADIADLPLPIGESNQFLGTALVDFAGTPTDPSDDLFLTSQGDLGVAATAQTTPGTDGNDVLLGSNGDDVLGGGAGRDLILGFGGDDVIAVNERNAAGLDGGDGRDILQLLFSGDLGSNFDALNASGFEALDLTNVHANELAISAQVFAPGDDMNASDVFQQDELLDALLSNLLGPEAETGQTATIYGDTSDSVRLVNEGGDTFARLDSAGTVDDGLGNQIDIYQLTSGSGEVLATLGIDTDVTVSVTAP